jgi:drug/metabolite transporter (DMT)-like permease
MSEANLRSGAAEMTVAMILAGTIGVFVTESGQTAFNVVFYRCVFGAVSLGLYCIWRGYLKIEYFDVKTTFLVVLGGVCIVFNWVFLFKSYGLTSISLGTVIYHTQPFYVVLLGAIIFKDTITRHKLGWIVLAFVGLILVTRLDLATLMSANEYVSGVGYALLAAILYAGNTISTKALKSIPPHLIALVHVTLGIVLLLPFATLSEVPLVGGHWVYLVSLGVIHTCVLYILMYSAYGKLPTPVIAVLSFIYPVVAILTDFVFYDRILTIPQWLGVVLILLSGLAVNRGWPIWPIRLAPVAARPHDCAPRRGARPN